ncbi:hypothetical protein [Verminephrobacter eiseniae]|uniref:hypothetical protein n=1 Tax=Verminephrobacter eiseniae TaxID=364317 RepID=UPI002237DBDB|nr:hypothetical protein [Verminephrobacter eiseniae]MCW5232055.1 hypothetical protein [Verminephrobacter eiseniae]MCW5296383.1 hypothetical protein [Verminephrobacter eiseniae]MCW8186559.1 hypothetical protein [Verminephrobacter eiseniae]MCW8224968.1 hypothetical protein [Verminephrobacter eiseniae]MCW8232924.1 hypothetical protein [Verminephrobacter eiseniae]
MNKLMGVNLGKLASVDANKLVESLGSLNCAIQFGCHSYASAGGEYEISRICISSNAENLQRLALVLLACAIGTQCETYLPIGTGGPTKGIQIGSERPSEYNPFHQPKSFTYTPKRELKRYPWYPWSLTCDHWTELPGFDLDDIPGESLHTIFDGRQDLRKPHLVCIYGYPKAFMRLARLLLDYASTDIPPEQIDLEIGGGFRGVSAASYEARFTRIAD